MTSQKIDNPQSTTMHPDAKPLTDAQRQKLCEMLKAALLEVRLLAGDGKSKQAFDLADAFHNLPNGMWRNDFSLQFFRDAFVAAYHEQHPTGRTFNYMAMIDEVIALTK